MLIMTSLYTRDDDRPLDTLDVPLLRLNVASVDQPLDAPMHGGHTMPGDLRVLALAQGWIGSDCRPNILNAPDSVLVRA